MNADLKSLETMLLIAICHQMQSKTLFLKIFLSTFIGSINIFNCHLSSVLTA